MIGMKTQGFTRVNKRRARNLFGIGRKVYVQSANFMPINPWQSAIAINPDVSFDNFVNAFEFYNCGDRERGYYAAFYVREEE